MPNTIGHMMLSSDPEDGISPQDALARLQLLDRWSDTGVPQASVNAIRKQERNALRNGRAQDDTITSKIAVRSRLAAGDVLRVEALDTLYKQADARDLTALLKTVNTSAFHTVTIAEPEGHP